MNSLVASLFAMLAALLLIPGANARENSEKAKNSDVSSAIVIPTE